MSKETQGLKTLYTDAPHHRLARSVAAVLNVTLREATERLLRGDPEAGKVARKLADTVAPVRA